MLSGNNAQAKTMGKAGQSQHEAQLLKQITKMVLKIISF